MDVQSILKEEKIMNEEIIHLNYKDTYGLASVQICEKMMTVQNCVPCQK